jgi:hypothetical protein
MSELLRILILAGAGLLALYLYRLMKNRRR